MSRRNLVGVLARALHEAVCEDLLEGPTAFEGEPDRIRAELVLLRLEDNGYAVEARQQGRDREARIEAAAKRVMKLLEPLDRQAADGAGSRHMVEVTAETWRYNATPIVAELRAALAGPRVRGGG